jgi:hypothetical protein
MVTLTRLEAFRHCMRGRIQIKLSVQGAATVANSLGFNDECVDSQLFMLSLGWCDVYIAINHGAKSPRL